MEEFLTDVDPLFDRICVASADTMQVNNEQRPLKDGQIQVLGTYEAIAARVQDGNTFTTVAEARPPAKPQMATTKDGLKKYPAVLPFFFRFESLSPEIPAYAELRTDGKSGWRLLADVKYFDEGSAFLRKHREAAWADPNNEEWAAVRDYITADGVLVAHRWLSLSPGDQIKMKLRDTKDNLFRRENPDQPGVPLVQPSTPLVLGNVKAIVWVTAKEYTETLPVPEGSPADTKPGTRKVTRLDVFPTYECKGSASVSPSYDKNMCLSERMHSTKNPHKHQLVPIEQYQSGAMSPARSAYFYVMRFWATPWVEGGDPQLEGVTLRREPATSADFKRDFNNEITGNCAMAFNLFQWRGRPHTLERYSVKLACAQKDKERIWTAYGITDITAYETILTANPELPVHVEAKLWDSASKGHTGNAPQTIRATEDMATMRGYYVYGIDELVPDYLRYFQGARGLKLSREFVLREFANWHSTNAAGRQTLNLQVSPPQADKVRRNPVNVFGDKGVITALGNGQLRDPTDLSSEPLFLAYAGEAMSLFTGRHDFYVLISHHMSEEEARMWAGPQPGNGTPYADAYLDNLRKSAATANRGFWYWIFAVLKDAKKAKPRARPQPVAVVNEAGKRERDEAPVTAPVQEKRAHVEAEADEGEGAAADDEPPTEAEEMDEGAE